MCGFVGFTHTNDLRANMNIKQMMDAIVHRGPDAMGYYVDQAIAFGFRRLSIIDCSDDGNQPFITEDKQCVLVFNGEIYNYKVLRKELVEAGYVFQSNTDSEVVLHGYCHMGMAILERLRGMFAFSIYDKKKQTLYLARDHFGIKPLYYSKHTTSGALIFGSEIKGLLKHNDFKKVFNDNALKPYLMFQYSALNETFFKGVFKVEPGTYLEYCQGDIKHHTYFSLNKDTLKSEKYDEQIHDVLSESVALHQQSDVKVGAFLSGGIDSSYIVALLKPDKTFSVGFKSEEAMFDETDLAAELSERLNIEHHKKIISSEAFFKSIPEIQFHMDEPHANLSSVPLYFLSELAKEHVTVVLSGEGADELFAGYDWYKKSKYLTLYEKVPYKIRKLIADGIGNGDSRVKNFIKKAAVPVEKSFIGQAKVFSVEDLKKLLKPKYQLGPCSQMVTQSHYEEVKDRDDLEKMQYLDMKQWLPGDILQKADKMSMAHSLELRVPYLDKRVYEVASKIPFKERLNNLETKIPLRQASKKVLPEEWVNRKKVGFPVPIKYWLREEKYYNKMKSLFSQSWVEEFFCSNQLIDYLTLHYEGKENHARYVWTVYVFLVWYSIYFKEHLCE